MNARVSEMEVILADKDKMVGPAGPLGPQGDAGAQGNSNSSLRNRAAGFNSI